MITNDEQLTRTIEWLKRFENDAALVKIQLDALQSQINELRAEILAYEIVLADPAFKE